ncbi:hybrid sensor histidine kinase/response regulator transcription factor [Chondrinema litorale]|uniref:hybrid sensor histidine kinase/response regulator transcription factor n=1 Tax=Chondrinema litorale TaxID=2994555 RepID=UPI002542C954|nr:hybrid sensor histidine kinase/response regulator transcription factor [Chondrinema litorale]UZR99298.1 response regulator [Chondrinema litorale]
MHNHTNISYWIKHLYFLLLFTTGFITQGIADDHHYSFIRINNNNGLINNQTTAILKDSRGFVWFGTSSGLSRFDGSGFKNYIHSDKDSTSLLDNFIENMQEDADGNLWIQMRWYYSVFNFENDTFTSLPNLLDKNGLHNEVVEKVYIDKEKQIWFKTASRQHYVLYDVKTGTLSDPFSKSFLYSGHVTDFYHDGKNYYYLYTDGTIECFNGHGYQLLFRDGQLSNLLTSDNLTAKIFVDREGDLWIYGNDDGVYYYHSTRKKWQHFSVNSEEVKLSSNLIKKIVQDNAGAIWIGTDHGGIDIFDKYTQSIQTLFHQPENPKSISQNSITDLLVDEEGIVWIGTYKNGICYYHQNIHKFPHYRHLPSAENSLPYNDVNCFVEDSAGNLWIGTNGGGLFYFDRTTGKYTTYKNDPEDKNSLSNNVVVNLFIDNEGLLWVGTFTGGLNVYDGKKFTRFITTKNNYSGLPNNNIWTINQDNDKMIWIGTLGSGIVLYDKEKESFLPIPNLGRTPPPSEFITNIHKMRNGNMFIATAMGVVFYDTEKRRFQNHPNIETQEPFNISNNNVNEVYEDSRGLLWIATREGLTVINPFNNTVKRFSEEDDLPEDIINCILEDDDKAIWVSKSTGISQIKPVQVSADGRYEYEIHNYTEADGLQGMEFNVNARFKTSKGELIFGGPNGYNLFQPKNIKYNTNLPDVAFTDFQIFNRSISVAQEVNGLQILDKSIVSTGEITLKHSMNVFSIEFVALNFFIPDKVKYKYMLEGFDNQWIDVDDHIRKVTYTNLNPGKYTFKVKASNNDGIWNEDYAQLQLSILPPFYKTPIAYFFYTICIVGILFYYRYSMLKKERVKFKIEQERLQNKRHIEMDEMKLKFLTNVSHEFRTPLTLIMAPLEKLMKKEREPSENKLFETIERNTHQLMDLVNQLLDFRKLELHGLKFNPSYGDIVTYLKEVCDAFSESFKKKGIQFEFKSNKEPLFFLFDHEKINKVMMNLLSNALKFTQEGGKVTVFISYFAGSEKEDDYIELKVKDTGVGILDYEKEKIFERFYQSKNNLSLGLSGSGIGLNLAREMIQLHNGTITVESEEGKGAEFCVTLPFAQNEEQVTELPTEEITEAEDTSEVTEEKSQGKQSVLLVEDNYDFRVFMRETLQDKYQVFEAPDGKKGIDLVHQKHPDLIISDVMMPEMDGMEMCKKLKKDVRTSHIPLILLTARTADEDKIKGLEIGADDYITKPFKMELLLLRLQNLIDKQKQTQKRFQKKMDINTSEIEISSIDEKLLKKAIALVEKNISEPKFSVEDMSHELGMSRVYLYKKLMAITGRSPIEFIRIIRLKRGAQLLEKSQMTIAEVAYEVGFNSPRYFSKYFEEEYGMLPSVFIKQHKEKDKKHFNINQK